MTDDSLEAQTIGIDHTAMLQANSQQNAAFMQTFGNYMPQQPNLATTGTTQLAQSSEKPATPKQSATARLNAKLAAQMQASLTASTQGDSLMTPNFVSALEQATGHTQMLTQHQQQRQKAMMDALSMTQASGHILPAKLRTKFSISTVPTSHNLTPQEAASLASPTDGSVQQLSQTRPTSMGGNPEKGSSADNSFLAAEPMPQVSAKELIKRAALKQMNSMPAPKEPAPAAKAAP